METVLNALTRWMLVFALMLAYWPFARHVHADTLRPVSFKKALYTARFAWNGGHYLFTVGTVARSSDDVDNSRFAALITKNGAPAAVCERKVTGEMPFDTNSMLLRCEGSMFAPAAATIKFTFGPSLDNPKLTLWTSPRAAGRVVALRGEDSRVEIAKKD